MRYYKEKLDNLTREVGAKFDELIARKGLIDFIKKVLIENDIDFENGDYDKLNDMGVTDELPIIEVRNSTNGETFDVQVLSITEDGMSCVKNEDNSTHCYMRFSDIASLEYQIQLLTEMDNEFC